MVGLLALAVAVLATPAAVVLAVAWLALLVVRLAAPGRWGWLVATGGTLVGVGIALLAAQAQGWGWRDAWDSALGAQLRLLGGLRDLVWAVLLVNVARVINPTGAIAQAPLAPVWPAEAAVRTYAVATWIAATVVGLPLAWLGDARLRVLFWQEGAEVGEVGPATPATPGRAATVVTPLREERRPTPRPGPHREQENVARPVLLHDLHDYVAGIRAALGRRERPGPTFEEGPALADRRADSGTGWRRATGRADAPPTRAAPAAGTVSRDASPPPAGSISRRPGSGPGPGPDDDDVYDAEFRHLDPTRDRRDWDDPFNREDAYLRRDPYDRRDPFRTRHEPDRPGEGELGEGEDESDAPRSPNASARRGGVDGVDGSGLADPGSFRDPGMSRRGRGPEAVRSDHAPGAPKALPRPMAQRRPPDGWPAP